MGGSRCTYKNCSMKSDGVIHMFHYPVYDKKRCHEWLVNAHRFDFLNLKLSQLKNRVVCQHHFKDGCFMNYKKEKLTFDAIPTEDGPCCKTTSKDKVQPSKLTETISLVLNDIDSENDKYMKMNLKHNPSMTYADFLTNGDVWEKQSLNETIWNNMVITEDKKIKAESNTSVNWQSIDEPDVKLDCPNSSTTIQDPLNIENKIKQFENPLVSNENVQATKGNNWQYQIEPVLVRNEVNKAYIRPKTRQQSRSIQKKLKNEFNSFIISPDGTILNPDITRVIPEQDLNIIINPENNSIITPFNNFEGSNILPNIDNTLLEDKNSQTQQQLHLVTSTGDFSAIIENPNELPIQITPNNIENPLKDNNYISLDQWRAKQSSKQTTNMNATPRPKVKILSQKTISDPVLVQGRLEPVSPSSFINIPKMIRTKPESNEIKHETEETEDINIIKDLQPITDINQQKDNEKSINTFTKNNKRNKFNEVPTKQSILKPKITPERVAAIEKKRNFNKKLRDIIEICLDKLDEEDKISEDVKANSPKVINSKENKSKSLNQNITSFLSKESDLPSPHEYTMKFLEERIKKMENTLLNKIEQNSQRIIELKSSITKAPQGNKAACTQTASSEEAHKKQLYNEISKFLSPAANSLLYEELFINNYAPKLPHQPSSPKRRKRR